MKHGMPTEEDAEAFRSIYKKLDIYGMTREPLTTHEMVLIFSYGKFVEQYFRKGINGDSEQHS